DVFQDTVQRAGERDALVIPHQRLRFTWRELAGEVERTARGLCGLGLRSGDRVGVWSTNCAEWVLVHLACARIGAGLVNVNPSYRAHDLAYVLQKSGMKALFLWEKYKTFDYRSILQEAISVERPALETTVYFGASDWTRMLERGIDVPPVAIST